MTNPVTYIPFHRVKDWKVGIELPLMDFQVRFMIFSNLMIPMEVT